jgi:hypothetical protein
MPQCSFPIAAVHGQRQRLVTGNSLDGRKVNSRRDQMGDCRMSERMRRDLVRVPTLSILPDALNERIPA